MDDYGDEYSSEGEGRMPRPQMVEVSSEESCFEDADFDILTSDRFFEQMEVAFQTIGSGSLFKIAGQPQKGHLQNSLKIK